MSGTAFVPLGYRHLDQLADASLIDRREGILFNDLQLLVRPQEGARIVAAHAQACLRQIVGPETEELGRLRDLIGGKRAARNLDHRAHQIIQLYTLFLHALRSRCDEPPLPADPVPS